MPVSATATRSRIVPIPHGENVRPAPSSAIDARRPDAMASS